MSIKNKLLVIILSTSGLCIALVAILLSVISIQNVKSQLISELNLTAEVIADNVTGALAFDDYERSKEILGSLGNNANMLLGCLYDRNDNLVANYESATVPNETCPVKLFDEAQNMDNKSLGIALPIQQGNLTFGTIYLRSDMQSFAGFIQKQFIAVLASLSIVLLVVAVPLANILQKIISKPIHELADASALIHYGSENKNSFASQTPQNEIEQIRGALGLLRSYINKGEIQLEKKSKDFLTVSRNNMLSMKYIIHEANTVHGSSELISEYFKDNKDTGFLEGHLQILDINSEFSKQLKESASEIYDLATFENAILTGGKQNVDLENSISKAYGAIFLKDDPHTRLNILYKDHVPREVMVYESALDRMMENIFSLFDCMRAFEYQHTINVTVEPLDQRIVLIFDLKSEEAGNNNPSYLENMGASLEKRVFLAKYFHTMLSPDAEPQSFSMDIDIDGLRVTCVLHA